MQNRGSSIRFLLSNCEETILKVDLVQCSFPWLSPGQSSDCLIGWAHMNFRRASVDELSVDGDIDN
jgi:hypothetical protein